MTYIRMVMSSSGSWPADQKGSLKPIQRMHCTSVGNTLCRMCHCVTACQMAQRRKENWNSCRHHTAGSHTAGTSARGQSKPFAKPSNKSIAADWMTSMVAIVMMTAHATTPTVSSLVRPTGYRGSALRMYFSAIAMTTCRAQHRHILTVYPSLHASRDASPSASLVARLGQASVMFRLLLNLQLCKALLSVRCCCDRQQAGRKVRGQSDDSSSERCIIPYLAGNVDK